MASIASPQPGSIYNVADNDPASRESVLDYVHTLRKPNEPAAPSKDKVGNSSNPRGDRSVVPYCGSASRGVVERLASNGGHLLS